MMLRSFTLCAALLLAHAGLASAQTVKLEFVNGLVNLSAQNVPVRAILAEWTRLGGTTIINADRVTGAPVTLEVQGQSERYVLDLVLRGVAGYALAARETAGRGSSRFDRVMILPTSTAPRTTASTAATFSPAPRPIPDDFDDDVDDDDITTLRQRDQEAVRRAEELARQRMIEQANRVQGQPVINGDAGAPTLRQATPFLPPQPQPQTGGPTPAGVSRPTNPFAPLPGSSRPGEVTPVPQQDSRTPPPPEQ